MSRFYTHAGLITMALLMLLGSGCATAPKAHDYTSYKQARPRSILVMPPLNSSPEVHAPAAVVAQAALPLAESGYYVLPVAVVDEVFKQNGMDNAAEAQAAPVAKLREIFGADAALYLDVRKYGTQYAVLRSDSVVALDAKLVDLRNGELLWSGSASASTAEQRANSGGGLVGMLVTALVNQVLDTVNDASYGEAGIANQRLLSAGQQNGLLYGPRSPKYQTD